MEELHFGWISSYDATRNSGFIEDDTGLSTYVHRTELLDGVLPADTPVRYAIARRIDNKGRPVTCAIGVERICNALYYPGDGLPGFQHPENKILEGTVSAWDRERGLGRIEIDGETETLFAHYTNVVVPSRDGFRSLNASDRVRFRRELDETRPDLPPRFQATHILLIGPEEHVEEAA
jgi:cold shock CspA family protein